MKLPLIFIFILAVFLSLKLSADDKKTLEEKEVEVVDFDKVKRVLEQDMLGDEVAKKIKKVTNIKSKRTRDKARNYSYPSVKEFWSFFSEYWLVKNSHILKWDFKKPDYGLDASFQKFLEKMGMYEKHFKILVVDSPNVFHLALPANPDEMIFVISLPFIRTLDLSKLEISLLLFEDYMRDKLGYFKKYVGGGEGGLNMLGKNFYKKKFKTKVFNQVLNRFDELIYVKGFSFQQQFEVTKQVGNILKNDLKFWNSYLQMLRKIDDLVKSNLLYSKYTKIYPSPELQINWLTPGKSKGIN